MKILFRRNYDVIISSHRESGEERESGEKARGGGGGEKAISYM